jgi:hypothetical protein
MNIVTFLTENVEGIFAVLFAIHAAALAIVNLTPTPKDDAIVSRVYGVLEVLAGIFTKKAKE